MKIFPASCDLWPHLQRREKKTFVSDSQRRNEEVVDIRGGGREGGGGGRRRRRKRRGEHRERNHSTERFSPCLINFSTKRCHESINQVTHGWSNLRVTSSSHVSISQVWRIVPGTTYIGTVHEQNLILLGIFPSIFCQLNLTGKTRICREFRLVACDGKRNCDSAKSWHFNILPLFLLLFVS